MNALTVLSVAVLAASSAGQLYTYPGFLPSLAPVNLHTAAPITLKTVAAAPTPITLNALAHAPLTYNVAPVAAFAPVAPVAPIKTQYHAQDELGQYSFGFAGGPSSRVETRDVFGVVRGSYNYVDADGKIQTQHYVADDLGFRVSATNLPVAPEAPIAEPLALPGPLPEPVQDTPEVTEAKAAFQKAFDDAVAAAATAANPEPVVETAVAEPAAEEAATSRKKRAIAVSPLRFSYGFSSPLAYNYPAVVGATTLQYTATSAFSPAITNIAAPVITSYAAPAPAITTYAAPAPAITSYAAPAPAITTYAAPAPDITTYTAPAPAITTYAAPAPAITKSAELLRITNNPGHAVSYRVD